MLTVDELWLTHAARLRANATVTLEDIKFEDLLFKVEALLLESQSKLAPMARTAQFAQREALSDRGDARAPRGSRRWTTARFQPR